MPVSLVGNTLLGILWRLKRRKKFYSHLCAVCTDSELQLGLSSCFWGFASSLNYRGNTQNPLAAVRNAVCQCGLRSPTQITAVGMAGYHAQPMPVCVTRDLSRLSHSSLLVPQAVLPWHGFSKRAAPAPHPPLQLLAHLQDFRLTSPG